MTSSRFRARRKYAFFYTIHDAYKEFNLNARFFNRSKFLRENFDIIVNCNCYKRDICLSVKTILSRFDNSPSKELHFDPINEGGHLMGPPEQIAHSFSALLPYELVFHLHADVYVVSDHGLKNFIKEWEDPSTPKYDFYTFQLPNYDRKYAFDAWLFSPSEKTNVFKDWKAAVPRGDNYAAEAYLYDSIHNNNLSVGLFDRGPHAGLHCEYEPNSGLIDTTHREEAISIFDDHDYVSRWSDFYKNKFVEPTDG